MRPFLALTAPQRQIVQTVNALLSKRLSVLTVTAALALDDDHDILLCNATSAGFTVTLPKADGYSGRVFCLKKTDASANIVTIDGNGSETIDGAANKTLAVQWESKTVVSDGTAWFII